MQKNTLNIQIDMKINLESGYDINYTCYQQL